MHRSKSLVVAPAVRGLILLTCCATASAQRWAPGPRQLTSPFGEVRAVADLDGDGALDLVHFTGSSLQGVWTAVTCLPNLGSCAFQPGPSLPLAPNAALAIVVADVDGDQQPDLIATAGPAHPGGQGLLFHRGLPGGAFASPTLLPLPRAPIALAVGDANGDALTDVAWVAPAATGSGPTVGWALGVPAQPPAMQPPFVFVAAVALDDQLAAFDRDGDGDDDLAVLSQVGVELLDTQQGALTWPGAVPIVHSIGRTLLAADLDADGDEDLLVARTPSATTLELTRLTNQAGALAPANQTMALSTLGSFHLADLDGDGDADGFQRNPGGLAMLENVGATFVLRRTQVLGPAPAGREPGFVDVDGDGHLDFVDRRSVWFGSGDFAARDITIDQVGGDLRDEDDDGDLDLTGSGGSVARNDGSGTFTTAVVPLPPPGTNRMFGGTIVLADFDGDRRNERLVTRVDVGVFPPAFETMVRLEDTGAGAFVDHGPVTAAAVPMTLPAFAVDVSGDGLLDVVDRNGIWLQQPGVTFPSPQPLPLGGTYHPIAAGDVDGDGDVDFLAGRNGSTLGLAVLVQAAGTLTQQTIVATNDNSIPVRRAAFADLDEDGDLDVAVDRAWASGQFEVWANQSGTFSLAWSWTSPGPATAVNALAADVDGDGRTDVAFAVGDTLRVFRRTSAGFTYEGPFDFHVEGARALADLDGDGDADAFGSAPARSRVIDRANGGGPRQYGLASPGSGGIRPLLGASGPMRPGATHVVRLRDALGGAPALLAFGQQPAALPIPVIPGLVCYTFPVIVALGFPVGGAPGAGRGVLDVPIAVPPAFAGQPAYFQGFVFDAGAANGLAHSNGLECWIGF